MPQLTRTHRHLNEAIAIAEAALQTAEQEHQEALSRTRTALESGEEAKRVLEVELEAAAADHRAVKQALEKVHAGPAIEGLGAALRAAEEAKTNAQAGVADAGRTVEQLQSALSQIEAPYQWLIDLVAALKLTSSQLVTDAQNIESTLEGYRSAERAYAAEAERRRYACRSCDDRPGGCRDCDPLR